MLLRSGDTVRVSSLTFEYEGAILKDLVHIYTDTGRAVFYIRESNGMLKIDGNGYDIEIRQLDMQKLKIYYKPWE